MRTTIHEHRPRAPMSTLTTTQVQYEEPPGRVSKHPLGRVLPGAKLQVTLGVTPSRVCRRSARVARTTGLGRRPRHLLPCPRSLERPTRPSAGRSRPLGARSPNLVPAKNCESPRPKPCHTPEVRHG